MARHAFVFFLLAATLPAASLAQQKPADPSPALEIEHVPERLAPAEQKVEDRCVRLTSSHAARDRDDRQTKGTQGTHGECTGQRFSGTNNDLGSGIQSPAAVR